MAETELIISQHFQVHNLLMTYIIKSTQETITLITGRKIFNIICAQMHVWEILNL